MNKIISSNRVNELLTTKRLKFKFKQSNTTRGLYHLIEKYVNEETTMVELGSFSGISSELFALHCKKIYCIDPWEPYWEINDENLINLAELEFDKMITNYKNIIKIKNFSYNVVENFENNSLDLIYIDSDHSYENVKREIFLWIKKIKNNGYISGHDINLPTVFNAVTEIFDPTYIELFNDTSWIVDVNKTK